MEASWVLIICLNPFKTTTTAISFIIAQQHINIYLDVCGFPFLHILRKHFLFWFVTFHYRFGNSMPQGEIDNPIKRMNCVQWKLHVVNSFQAINHDHHLLLSIP